MENTIDRINFDLTEWFCRVTLSIFACIGIFVVHAGSVEWNDFSITALYYNDNHGHQTIGAEFVDVMSYPSVSMRVEADDYGLQISKADSMPSLIDADWTLAAFAQAGDVLTWNYFKNVSSAIENDAQYGLGKFKNLTAPEISEPIQVDYDTDVYLAIVFWTDETPGYTWCKLTATENGFSLCENATAFQEGLIVGKGSFAPVPEPSGCLPLLFGLAFIAIRRQLD